MSINAFRAGVVLKWNAMSCDEIKFDRAELSVAVRTPR
jgi:hypothetical protein